MKGVRVMYVSKDIKRKEKARFTKGTYIDIKSKESRSCFLYFVFWCLLIDVSFYKDRAYIISNVFRGHWLSLYTVDFEIWHLELITGLVVLISSCRYLLLKAWPDFAESSDAANQQVCSMWFVAFSYDHR